MSELLESRWQDTKTALLEGLEGNKKSVMGVTLENTRKYLAEAATAGASSAGNVATLNRVILPVIRRVMPTVIANELVGVQPMTGPVGQIHTLRVRYADSMASSATATTAGEEALSPFKIAEGYSGAGDGGGDGGLGGGVGDSSSVAHISSWLTSAITVGHGSRPCCGLLLHRASTSRIRTWSPVLMYSSCRSKASEPRYWYRGRVALSLRLTSNDHRPEPRTGSPECAPS